MVYQIYPRSFKDANGDGIGDLQGIISKIDYLVELGIDIVWLSPHFDSPNADNGYDIRDYKKVMEAFGTMNDFDEMLAKFKQKGIKLIIDLVVNHSSDEHVWFKESKSSKENPYRDYYIWRSGRGTKEPSNWPSFFGGSAWEKDPETEEYYLHYFSKKQPDLNWENSQLREEVYAIMRFWLDKGVDGFRMDVIPLISKHQDFQDMSATELKHPETIYASGPRIHEFLREMNDTVLSKYDVMTVGEGFGVTTALTQRMTDERRKELNLSFLFDIIRVGRDNWQQGDFTLPELKELFTTQNDTDNFHWPTVFLNNHDNPRSVSKFGCDSEENRVRSAKLLALLTLTQRGTPFLYQGEEIGMTNYCFKSFDEFDDVEIRGNYRQILQSGVGALTYLAELNKSSRDHSRTPMQWSNSHQGGFTTAEKSWLAINENYTHINAESQQKDSDSIFNFYKKLLEIRRRNEDLVYGDYFDIAPDHEQVFAYTRTGVDKTFLIVLNMSSKKVSLKLDAMFLGYKLIVSNSTDHYKGPIKETLELAHWEARMYVSA